MKEIITYIAFDQNEFDNKEECQEYEDRFRGYINEITSCSIFYNESMMVMPFHHSENIEDELDWLETLWNKCEYIKVITMPNHEAITSIFLYSGINFPEKVGMYKYDYIDGNWVSMS